MDAWRPPLLSVFLFLRRNHQPVWENQTMNKPPFFVEAPWSEQLNHPTNHSNFGVATKPRNGRSVGGLLPNLDFHAFLGLGTK